MTLSDTIRTTRESSHGWYVQRLARRLDLWMAEELDPLGLSLVQFAILMSVMEHDDMTQTDIGNRFAMQPYAISRAIDGLEQAGHVMRKPHPTSRRAHKICATPKGKSLAPTLREIINRVNARLTEGLTPEQATALLDLLALAHTATLKTDLS